MTAKRVHGFLVTAPENERINLWANTAVYANWLDGRENAAGTETWHVMVFDEHAADFLGIATDIQGLTVEEIEGAGDTETYILVAGVPGTGWASRP